MVCGWVCYSMTLCVCVVWWCVVHGSMVGMCGAWCGGGGGVVHGVSVSCLHS